MKTAFEPTGPAMTAYLRKLADDSRLADCRQDICRVLDKIDEEESYRTMEADHPWVTDLFLFGLLDSEDALNEAKLEILQQFAQLEGKSAQSVETLQEAWSANVDEGGGLGRNAAAATRRDAAMRSALDDTSADRLGMAWHCLRYLGEGDRELRKGFLKRLEARAQQLDNAKAAKSCSWFARRLAILPCPLSPEWKYRRLAEDMGEKDMVNAEVFEWNFNRMVRAEVGLQHQLDGWLNPHLDRPVEFSDPRARLQHAARTLKSSSDGRMVQSLKSVSEPVRTRVAMGCQARELIFARLYERADQLNYKGVGNVPPLDIETKADKQGHPIADADSSLDLLVCEAFAHLSGGDERDGSCATSYLAFRKHQDGGWSEKYLTEMIDDAIIGRRHTVILPSGNPQPIWVEIDKPATDDEGNQVSTLDVLVGRMLRGGDDAMELACHDKPYDDFASFVVKTISKVAPDWMTYLYLTEAGVTDEVIEALRKKGCSLDLKPGDTVKKGEARRLVGARTPHFADRQRAAFIEALKRYPNLDNLEILNRFLASAKNNSKQGE